MITQKILLPLYLSLILVTVLSGSFLLLMAQEPTSIYPVGGR